MRGMQFWDCVVLEQVVREGGRAAILGSRTVWCWSRWCGREVGVCDSGFEDCVVLEQLVREGGRDEDCVVLEGSGRSPGPPLLAMRSGRPGWGDPSGHGRGIFEDDVTPQKAGRCDARSLEKS